MEPGQGKPLPLDFPYEGEWIIENLLFVYVPESAETPSSLYFQSPTGNSAFGLNAEAVAKECGLAMDDLRAANVDGRLSVKDIWRTSAANGQTGTQYLIAIGGSILPIFAADIGPASRA